MNVFRTKKTAPVTTSSAEIRLYAPRSWNELSQDQLRYVITLLAMFPEDTDKVKTYMFVRFTGIEIIDRYLKYFRCRYTPPGSSRKQVFMLRRATVVNFLSSFDYIDDFTNMDVRLDGVCGLQAVDKYMHGVAFIDYLNAETAFQSYLLTQDDSCLVDLLHILYRPKPKKKGLGRLRHKAAPQAADLLAAFLWYGFVIKGSFASAFPNFFRKTTDKESSGDIDIVGMINSEIRALTEGDITKEEKIYKMDCWRALTELDAKAREAREMQRMMDKNNAQK